MEGADKVPPTQGIPLEFIAYVIVVVLFVIVIVWLVFFIFDAFDRRDDFSEPEYPVPKKKPRAPLPVSEAVASLPPQPSPADFPPVETSEAAPFLLEALVSSGPRKTADEYSQQQEVCEDAAGFVHMQAEGSAHHIWWLCDGTSNGDYLQPVGKLPGLSTRLFARDLGECFRDALIEQGGRMAPDQWSRIIPRIENLWYRRFKEYLRGLSTEQRDHFLAETEKDGYILKWSCTFLGGVIDHYSDFRRITMLQAGDSGAVICTDQGNKRRGQVIDPTKDRIILQLWTRGGLEGIQLKVTQPETSVRQFDHLVGFAAMTDGVIRNSLDPFLKTLAVMCGNTAFKGIRDGLARRSDNSFDDKSMIIGWTIGS